MTSPQTRQKTTVLLIFILLLGFFLRAWRLDYFALRGDESFTMMVWMDHSIRDLLFGEMAIVDPQPPGAVLLIYSWIRLVGQMEFAARFLSVLSGVYTIAVMYRIGRLVSGRQAGLWAAFLWAINPYQVWFAQDLRSGALWVAISATSVWLMLQVMESPHKKKIWIAYVLVTALALYVFYLELFVLAAQNVYMLIESWRDREKRRYWIMSQFGILLLLIPWFAQPRLYAGEYGPTGVARLDIWWAARELLFGSTLPFPLQVTRGAGWAAYLAVLLVVGGLAVIGVRGRRKTVLWLALYTLLPLLLMGALVWVTSRGYFRPRYMLSSAPGWILILAVGLTELFRYKKSVTYLAGVMLVGVVILNGIGLRGYYFDPAFAKSGTWRELTDLLETQVGEGGDEIIVQNYPDPTFGFYYDGHAPLDITPPEVQGAPDDQLTTLRDQYTYLWFIPAPGTYWSPDNAAIKWFEQEMLLVSEQMAGTFRVEQYADFVAHEDEITHPTSIRFGDFVTLAGYNIRPSVYEGVFSPGDVIFVEVFWWPESTTEQPLTVFAHLLGPPRADGNPLWAGQDHPPQQGRVNTTSWEGGVLLRDVYRVEIPADAPAGTYQITLGFYNPANQERVLDIDGAPLALDGEAILMEIKIVR